MKSDVLSRFETAMNLLTKHTDFKSDPNKPIVQRTTHEEFGLSKAKRTCAQGCGECARHALEYRKAVIDFVERFTRNSFELVYCFSVKRRDLVCRSNSVGTVQEPAQLQEAYSAAAPSSGFRVGFAGVVWEDGLIFMNAQVALKVMALGDSPRRCSLPKSATQTRQPFSTAAFNPQGRQW